MALSVTTVAAAKDDSFALAEDWENMDADRMLQEEDEDIEVEDE